MGMYTECVLTLELKREIPDEVIGVLKHLSGSGALPNQLPNHGFFFCPRWSHVMRSCSYYFAPISVAKFIYDEIAETYYLFTRFDMKNYDGEIEKFVDWVMQFAEGPDGQFVGYMRYEEDESPQLFFKFGDTYGLKVFEAP